MEEEGGDWGPGRGREMPIGTKKQDDRHERWEM